MNLEIDHLYFTVSKKQFQTLLSDQNLAPYLDEIETVRPDMTYHGLYFVFQNAFYLEIVLEDKSTSAGKIGVALSDLRNNEIQPNRFTIQENLNVKQVKLEGRDFFKCLTFNSKSMSNPYVFAMDFEQEFLGRRIAIHYKYPHKLCKLTIYSKIKEADFDLELAKYDSTLIIQSEFLEIVESSREEVEVSFESEGRTVNFSFCIKK